MRQSETSTFLFADIAGYTALTEAHGDEEAAQLASDFCLAVADLIPSGQGELVKTIGDAVMVRLGDPATAVELGLRIRTEVLADHGSPTVRVGMHHGEAVERDGDWFGNSVNLAARVAGIAAGGEVLATGAVKEAVAERPELLFEERGLQRVRNVSRPVAIFAVLTNSGDVRERSIDPVCRMAVETGRDAGTLTHEGKEYRFCSLECAGRFAADPEAYVGAQEG